MSQTNVDFSDNPTGSELMDNYLAKEQENSLTSNSGIQRPSYAKVGTKWLDTSSEPWALKMYTGSGDVVIGYIDKSKGTFKPVNALPDLEGQNGKYLTTDGKTSFWGSFTDIDNKITNCITEIPQDIKLELNNGTLTLKAGSKLTDINETQFTTTSDYSINVGQPTGQRFLFAKRTGNAVGFFVTISANTFSGETQPTPTTVTAYWYDTENKVMKITQDTGKTWSEYSGATFPIASVIFDNGKITSIDQAFNGFGYIGSTIFALPGVKGLIPDGRNEDGTLKNIEFVIQSVKTYTSPTSYTFSNYGWVCSATGDIIPYDLTKYEYREYENYNYELYNNKIHKTTLIAHGSVIAGVTTSFIPKLAFRAVDYNDFNKLDSEVAKLDEINTFTKEIIRREAFSGASPYTIRAVDTNGKGDIAIIPYYTANTIYHRILATNTTSNKNASFDVTVKDDGTATIYFSGSASTKTANFNNVTNFLVPTPAEGDNSQRAVNTAWVNTKCIGFPNYAGKISTTEATYTCPDNGWLYVQMMGLGEANTWGYAYINGAEVGCVQSKASRSVGDSSIFIPVLKGDVLTFDGNINTGLTKIFYPFK